jgi:hypothetical protein
MDWATMPEASIHKDGYLVAGKDDVRLASNRGQRSPMNSETKSAGMKRRPKLKLELRIARTVRLHRSTHGERNSP